MMHKVKTQRFGELFVKNMIIIYFYMITIKTYEVKKFQKTGINFRKFSAGSFRKFLNSQP